MTHTSQANIYVEIALFVRTNYFQQLTELFACFVIFPLLDLHTEILYRLFTLAYKTHTYHSLLSQRGKNVLVFRQIYLDFRIRVR